MWGGVGAGGEIKQAEQRRKEGGARRGREFVIFIFADLNQGSNAGVFLYQMAALFFFFCFFFPRGEEKIKSGRRAIETTHALLVI